MKILCWNVNGIRSLSSQMKLEELFEKHGADVVCLQETKTNTAIQVFGYDGFWSVSKKPGYSGVVTYVKRKLAKSATSKWMQETEFVNEGRCVCVDLGTVTILNVYFPRGGETEERIRYKSTFHDAFLEKLKTLKGPIVVCGDFNIARLDIDTYNPTKYVTMSGFLPQERQWFEVLSKEGFFDAYRALYPTKEHMYTWWDQKRSLRNRNQGWRLDFFYISEDLKKSLAQCEILTDEMGSDHCPMNLSLDLECKPIYKSLHNQHDCDIGPCKFKKETPIHSYFSSKKRVFVADGVEIGSNKRVIEEVGKD